MTQEKTSVLVSGAGPTGLMAACQLARYGIPFRIIDKSADHTNQSRALVLHARSLEVFKQMGLADKALALGEICEGASWVFNGKEVASIKVFGENLTEFPYILCLEQSKTEELLIDYLSERGYSVERETELVDYVDNEPGITATLRKADGSEETVSANYIIGADGAHSIVREKMGLHMEGSTYLQTLFVIDCQVQADIRPKEIYIAISEKGLIGFFPMVQSHEKINAGHHRYRVLGVLPKSDADKVISFDEIEQNFSDRAGMPATIYDPAWISTYKAHHRHAKTFRKGNGFIIGDAAHIHSPVGGQGMNTGLQDAYNLVWKLDLVLKNRANDVLLDTFNQERMAVAKKLVASTDRMFYMIAGESPLIKFFRLKVMPWMLRAFNQVVHHSKSLKKAVFFTVSQIGIKYPNSLLSENASVGTFPKAAPKSGDRFPFITFEENGQKKNIQDALQGTSFHWFIFSKKPYDQNALISPKIARHQDLLTIHHIPYNSGTEHLYKTLGIIDSGYYLVRPDMYIAFRSASLDTAPLEEYGAQFVKAS
jgi:2-polyprenyl-6-methoxyphenol hydroxylase-like FAD-dependent oxidoreductase